MPADPATPTIEDMVAAVELAINTCTEHDIDGLAALYAARNTLSALSPLIEAARELVEKFCAPGIPSLRKDDMLPDAYWSPAARMLDAASVMKLRDALSTFPVPASRWRPIESAPKEPIDEYGYGPAILLRAGGFVISDQWKPGLPEYPLQSHWRNWPYVQPRTPPALWMPLDPAASVGGE